MAQLTIPFEFEPDYSAANFVVLSCNRAAYEALPQTAQALLVGERESGKTHLLKMWQDYFPTGDIIENIDLMSAQGQETAFHIYNQAMSAHTPLLVTITQSLAEVTAMLPDLKTRLSTLPQLEITLPSEADLRVLIHKWLTDRQVEVDDSVITYLLNHAPRTPAQLQAIIAEADRRALVQKRKLSTSIIKAVLTDL